MTDRITDKHLEHLVDRINEVTGSPRAAYTKDADGNYKANVGNYHMPMAVFVSIACTTMVVV